MNQRWVLDYALGYQTFGGLPWTSFFWPRLHTYPPLQWGLEGRQLYLYRLGLKNRVSILESTWGSFSRKTYGYWVLKQKTKNRCPLQPSLTNFIFLSRVMTLILQYLKLMVTERRQIPWSPRERDKRWRGPGWGTWRGEEWWRALTSMWIDLSVTQLPCSYVISFLLPFQCSHCHTVELITRNTSAIWNNTVWHSTLWPHPPSFQLIYYLLIFQL